MKIANEMFRQIAFDGFSFVLAVAVTLGGLWGMFQIDTPLYIMNIFGVMMVPVLMSTAVYLGRDINEATHKLIA